MHPGIAAIETSVVDLINIISAGAVEKQLFIVCVFVLFFQVHLLVYVVLPKCLILNSFNLKTSHN